LDRPAVLRGTHLLIFFRQVGDNVHPGWVEPEEERLPLLSRLIEELERVGEDFFVYSLHAIWTQRTCVLDPLLTDLAPARLFCGVIYIRRPTVHHVARADCCLGCRWIVWMTRIFHGIQMVKITEKFIEAVNGWDELVQITEVVLAELSCGVPHGFE